MKQRTILILSIPGLLHAGSPDVETPLAPTPAPWFTPTLDIRSRYEFADIDGFDPSHAFSFRERFGIKTQAWNGFSAFLEGEFTQAAIDDYHGGARGAHPFDPANSVIADPETRELNQAYLQYVGADTTVKLGRQKLVYDNAAFIGDVIWRQNQQTFDAVTLQNQSIDKLTVDYAYLNQINRIFGSDAHGVLPNVSDVAADVHLFHASYTGVEGFTLGAYAYLMDFRNKRNWDNDTFGVSAKGSLAGLQWYAETAYQNNAGPAASEDALYAHATLTKAIEKHSVTVGLEHLDAGFKTPLATVHAFNGFADAFITGRMEGTHRGLTDLYVAHTMPLPVGIKWTNVLHAFGDNEISTGYGWEYDSVLAKMFNANLTAIAKLAVFEADDDAFAGSAPLRTTTRFSLQLDYSF